MPEDLTPPDDVLGYALDEATLRWGPDFDAGAIRCVGKDGHYYHFEVPVTYSALERITVRA